MSEKKTGRNNQAIIFGAVPRANLLPPELRADEVARAIRRRLVFVLVLVLAVVIGGYAYSAVNAELARQQLVAASTETDNLLAEQTKYLEVRQLASQVSSSEEALGVAMATDVDWATFTSLIDSSLLSVGAGVTAFEVTASTPFSAVAPSTALLENDRVAEVTFTGVSPTLPVSANWVRALQSMTGFADAKVTALTFDGQSYAMTIVLHLNSDIYRANQAAETETTDAPDTTESTEEDGE